MSIPTRSTLSSIGAGAVFVGLFALILLVIPAQQAEAYPTVDDPDPPGPEDTGSCMQCHNTWPSRNDAHDQHVSPLTGTCNFCHSGSGRNSFTLWSAEAPNFGCMGCHGKDYGETIELPNGFAFGGTTWNLNGLPKRSGYGMRKQHLRKGIVDCLACHTDVPRSFIQGENVLPAYYSDSDSPDDPCLSTEEDSSPEPTSVDDTVGLDNDGDGRIDSQNLPMAVPPVLGDPDCNGSLPTTPGEASAPFGSSVLQATAIDGLGNVTINYGSACSATNHALYVGALTPAAMQNGTYSSVDTDCSIGASPHTFNPGTGDVFFLVVGDDGSDQGSYGESFYRDGSAPAPFTNELIYHERPGDPGLCSLTTPLDLSLRCD